MPPARGAFRRARHNAAMPRGRPLAFDPEAALDAAMNAFWSRGYVATSLEQLLAATGLSRSSLYQVFGSKAALFARCVERYRVRRADHFAQILDAAPSGLAFLAGVLDTTIAECAVPDRSRGCLLLNTTRELGALDATLATQVSSAIGDIAQVFEQAIARAQREGTIDGARDARELAHFFLANIGGLFTLVQAGVPAQVLQACAAQALRALE